MYVVATAGHVDHGKSTLVRALTGMEPDRFAEEKRRGMTIDLGYAWTRLTGEGSGVDGTTVAGSGGEGSGGEHVAGESLSFVDVPGHERFIATMLAGLGPAPAVMFVVAADEGWRRQSEEHLAAIDALGLRHGVLVVTRSDLADPREAAEEARHHIAESSLGAVDTVSVSARTGRGLQELRSTLGRLVARLPPPRLDGRVRLWVDRSFTIRGAGTVVTGTLGAGSLAVGDQLQLGDQLIRVRGLQSLGESRSRVDAVARVAVNLRGVEVDQVGRGDALLTPRAWPTTALVDVRCRAHQGEVAEIPAELVLHLGTAAVPVHVRPLGGDMARLTLLSRLPLEPGDRLVLRDPGRHAVAAGAVVLDADPPALSRRGAAAARAASLVEATEADAAATLAVQVRRRGAARRSELEARGIDTEDSSHVLVFGDWLVDPDTWQQWQLGLAEAVSERARSNPLDPRLSLEAARNIISAPDRQLLLALADATGLSYAQGKLSRADEDSAGLGPAEPGMRQLEAHLTQHSFVAPEKPDLERWGLGVPELAAAERVGRVVRLAPDVVLLRTGPAQAMRVLSGLNQPFTTSEARLALATTRRVAIPLLEYLDRRGWTVRLDSGHRQVKR